MADVGLVFSGKTEDAEKAYRKLEREHLKMVEQLKKVTAESKKANDAQKKSAQESGKAWQMGSDFLKGQAAALGGMVAGLASVQTAISFVKQTYGEWRQEIDDISAKHKQFSGDLVRTLGATGDLAQGGKIQRAIEGTKGATREEATQVFGGVRGALPVENLDRVLALTKEAAGLSAVFDPGKIGQAVGEIADLSPKMKANDVVDMAVTVIEQAGNDADALISDGFLRSVKILQGAGLTVEEGFAMGIAALDAHLNPKIIEQMAAAVETPPEVAAKRGERLSPEDALKQQFGAASKKDRLQMLMTDQATRDAILGKQALKAGLISPEKIGEVAGEIRAGMAGDAGRRTVADLGKFGAGSVALDERAVGQRRQQARMRREGAITARNQEFARQEADLIEAGVPEFAAGKVTGVKNIMADTLDALDTRAGRAAQSAARTSAVSTIPGAGAAEAGFAATKWLADLVVGQREQTAILRKRGNRPVGAHSE